jgi:hypothetical protein
MTNSIYCRNQNLHTQAVHPKGLARRPTDIDVLICTGNRDDALEGRLSGIATYQKAPWSDAFQELWVVRCVNGNFCKSLILHFLLYLAYSFKLMVTVDHGSLMLRPANFAGL